jgi:hypothetical protein
MSEDHPKKGDVRRVYLWRNGGFRLARIIEVDDYERKALVCFPELPSLRTEWVRFDRFGLPALTPHPESR